MPDQTLWWRPASRIGRLALLLAAIVLLAACSRNRATPAAQPADATAPNPAPPAANAANPVSVQPVDAVKLAVDQPGLYRVTASDLAAAGFDPARDDPARLALTLDGQPVTLVAEGTGDALELTFYGEPRASRYGQDNIYRLGWDSQPRPAVGRTLTAGDGPAATTFTARQTLEEATTYLSQLPADSDHWLCSRSLPRRPLTCPLTCRAGLAARWSWRLRCGPTPRTRPRTPIIAPCCW